ncbi:MAG: hypothetical protein A2V70_14720 [Planctomycetes bacterium RBG_13_63_9]|nr:MAG: hypothetical protein A2V70_14720 [Planctomycetes bacterium RBG_13_63_9]
MAHHRSGWRQWILTAVCLAAAPLACRGEESVRLDHVVVSYTGVSEEYAQAIARTVAAARAVAIERFGFDMPETITVTVTADPKGTTRLFNDGQDHFSLTVRSQQQLAQPSSSGIFHLYGMCHEVGHLAMYRPIRDHGWMTTGAAEGWAHYLGSRIVDEVYRREGEDLWPDRYDYRADGMKRLEGQLASSSPGDVSKGAGLWKDLAGIVGDKGVAPIFEAWGKARPDSADPGKVLGEVLLGDAGDKRLSRWWDGAQEVFVFKRPKSDFLAKTSKPAQLSGKSRELLHDDGRAAGKKSIAGGGHAVRFEVPGDRFCVTSVRINGSRYGQPRPPDEDFRVWICDADFQTIAEYRYPYSNFGYGKPGWVKVRLKPTLVPKEFIVCVGFDPTATKGVFMNYDGEGSGDSLVGLPGKPGEPFHDGDWLIRATVDQLKGAEAGPSDRKEADRKEADRKEAAAPTGSTRTWTDATGSFKIEAEFLGLDGDKVRLRKSNGRVITVPLQKLSDADQQFARKAAKQRSP